jgi:apolipoprotein N-acyltransferase
VSPGARRLSFGALYVLGLFLSFPHPLGEGVVDLGSLLVWSVVGSLLLAVEGLPPARAFRRGLLLGVLGHAAVWHWIYVVTVTYGHAPVVVGVLAPLGLALWPGLFVGAFAALAPSLGAPGWARPLVLAAAYTALDWLRGWLFTGFPWGSLGYALHEDGAILGLAAWTGVHGLTFAAALAGASLAELARANRGALAGRAAAVGLVMVLALHGLGLVARPSPVVGESVRIGLAQGNIAQGVKWSPDWAERTLAIYAALTHEAAAAGAEWVLWPETAVPGSLDHPEMRERLGALAREAGVGLMVGAVGLEIVDEASPPRFFDSAFPIGADGSVAPRYDKSHLVPFGEYLPFRSLLGRFVRAVATGSAGRDVTPGTRPMAVALPGHEPPVRVGVPICYELLFPDLVRRFVGDGGQALLAMTNDAWYGRTGAPYQFLAITALRSAETGVWTARAANTGVSAFIDGRGRVREQTRIFERSVLVDDVPLRPVGAGKTFYVRVGDGFAWGCLGVLAAALGGTLWHRNRRQSDGEQE